MKRFVLFIIVLFSISLYGGVNLLYNGDFETWIDISTPDKWFFESGVTFTKDSSVVYEGSYSAMVTLTTDVQSNTDTYPYDTIAVTPGNTYTYSFMVYDNDIAGSVRLVIEFFDASKVSDSIHYDTYSSDIDGWQELSYTFTVPSDVYYILPKMRFYDNSTTWDGDAIFYIDSVYFGDTTSATGNTPPSISNVSHTPPAVQEGDTVIVSADITDNSGIIADTLFYSVNGNSYSPVQKDSVSLNTYYYNIGSFVINDTVSYYIKAVDDSNVVSVSDTYSFVVVDIPDIKINEIGYDVDGIDPYAEWIELYNPEDYDVDISGWIITDYPSPDGGTEGSIELPAGTVIPSHGYFVIMCDADSFFTYYSLPAGVGYYAHNNVSLSLSNTGDDIHLYNADNMEIDAAWYESGGNIGPAGAAVGVSTGGSIGRSPDGYDTDDCSVDFYAYNNADITPGSHNLNRAPKILSYNRDVIVPQSGSGATITADVIDDYGISSVYVRYYLDGSLTDSVLMTLSKGTYIGDIPPQVDGSLVEYDIVAYDDSSLYSVSNDKQGYFSGITPISKIDINDSNGFPLYYGYGARVTGVVTVPSGVFNTYSTIINVQERGTTDALVAKVDTFIAGIDEGDSVIVEGTIGISTGQLRITDPGANITVIQPDVGIIDPVKLTAADLKDTVGEQWDGTFVYIWADTLTPSSGAWPSAGSSAALWVYDSTAVDSYKIWIDNDTDIDDNSEPSWHFYVAGVVSQYDIYSPYFEGYEIMPRYYTDFGYDLAFENISLTGYFDGSSVVLSWSVEGSNLIRFDIYRSYDKYDDYKKIGSVLAGASKYEYRDDVSLDRSLYYKIGAVKDDGSIVYFGPIKISSIIGTSSFRLYMPTLVKKDVVILRMYSPSDGVGELKITDEIGRIVYRKELRISNGINYIAIDPQLSGGLYIIKLKFGGNTYSRKIIVN